MTPEEDSRGPKKLSMDDFSLPVARELSSPAGESDMKVLYPEKEAKARMEDRQWVPSHSDEDRKLTPQELQKETHPSIEAMHCPICLELFPRQVRKGWIQTPYLFAISCPAPPFHCFDHLRFCNTSSSIFQRKITSGKFLTMSSSAPAGQMCELHHSNLKR
jgi:hypothetical protein